MKNIKARNILAVIIIILPVNIYMIYYRLIQTKPFTLSDMIVYPMIIGVPIIIAIIVLNKYFLKDTFKTTFNSNKSTWYLDLCYAFILLLVYFGILLVSNTISSIFVTNNNAGSTEVINAIRELADNPLLMIVWFGPVLWIGVALFEELSRVFFMKCLWNVWNKKYIHILVIVFVSVIIGLTHIYQGPIGAISIGIKSIIAGLFYYKYRRIFPLIIAHALYDGLQFLTLIIQINGI